MNVDKVIASIPGMSQQERDRVRTNADHLISTGNAAQRQAADRVLAALAEIADAEHQEIVDRLSGLEVSARVVEAFREHPMTETEGKVIQALLDHPGYSSTQLSEALGWGAQSWHMHFGTMCFNRAVYLWPAPKSETRGADFYSGILADWSPEEQWRMKPEVAAAFGSMGMHPKTNGASASS